MMRKIKTVLFSRLYPSSNRPGYGIFVEARLQALLASCQVETKVVSPVPWFFSKHSRFGDYARMASTPSREIHHGIDVQHPRYLLPPKVGMTASPFSLALGSIAAFTRLLDEGYDFDVIDAHYYYPDGVAAALLAWYFNKPFTVTARGSDINLISNYVIPRKLMHWSSSRATASIGVSLALTLAMEKMGMSASKLMLMPNGVDLERFQPRPQNSVRALLGWAHGPVLLCVGNLVENKGHHIAIQSLARLPGFRLVIIGEGPERNALEALARQNGVSSKIQFLGYVDQLNLADYYSAADIVLLPSSREGWPNVLLESMACGTPVVATRVGGIPEILLSNDSGRLMRERTVNALVEAVSDLWQQLPSRGAVRTAAQKFSWTKTTGAQVALFRRIVAKNAGEASCVT